LQQLIFHTAIFQVLFADTNQSPVPRYISM